MCKSLCYTKTTPSCENRRQSKHAISRRILSHTSRPESTDHDIENNYCIQHEASRNKDSIQYSSANAIFFTQLNN